MNSIIIKCVSYQWFLWVHIAACSLGVGYHYHNKLVSNKNSIRESSLPAFLFFLVLPQLIMLGKMWNAYAYASAHLAAQYFISQFACAELRILELGQRNKNDEEMKFIHWIRVIELIAYVHIFRTDRQYELDSRCSLFLLLPQIGRASSRERV